MEVTGTRPLDPGWRAAAGPEGLAGGSRMRPRTLILIRWIAVAGQVVALLAVRFGLGYQLPLGAAAVVVGASAVLNIVLTMGPGAARRLSQRDASLQLAFDIIQLAALLYLTGGLANPFAILLLAPVTISATNLKGFSTTWLAGLAVGVISFLGWFHRPLPWPGDFQLPSVYLFGLWGALVLGTAFTAVYAWRVAREDRQLARALAATQLALAREQKLSALGGLAAAAAHELGTPLGTIAVAAKELIHTLPTDAAATADIELIRSQALRCREILARLARERSPASESPFEILPFSALVREAADPHGGFGIGVNLSVESASSATEPDVRRSPEITHGLGNLIENAVGFARTRVDIRLSWDQAGAGVTIQDDGPGFAPGVLSCLGEPYVTSRGAGETSGLGLGVFIAKTLLEHTGANILFSNRSGAGARVDVTWPRAALDTGASKPADRSGPEAGKTGSKQDG